MRLVTPGDVFESSVNQDCAPDGVTDSATENIPPKFEPGDSSKENLRDIFFGSLSGKGEKVG